MVSYFFLEGRGFSTRKLPLAASNERSIIFILSASSKIATTETTNNKKEFVLS
jgi:hypothetical protein